MTQRLILRATLAAAASLLFGAPFAAHAQDAPKPRGSSNLQVLANVALPGPPLSHSDVEIEQDLDRPYVYAGRILKPSFGFDIIDISNPATPEVLYEWRVENAELHQGLGGMDNKYFKLDGRYYLVQSFQFFQGGPDFDLGAIVVDVTGLPDASTVKEVGRIRAPETPGGFHNIFLYHHSSGRVLLFTTVQANYANVYDMGRFIAGDPDQGFVGRVPFPDANQRLRGYHDFYVAFDPATGQDKFYGAGDRGYYVFDVTTPEQPELVTSITGVPGVQAAHTITATPDGRFAVAQTEYPYSPVRLYDLKPGLDGDVQTISTEEGVWTANWRHFTHNNEMRWPYVFVSAFKDGLYVFDMRDLQDPTTVAWFDTYPGAPEIGLDTRSWSEGISPFNGAWGVDVRNADGLIVASDFTTGVWLFRMDGFDGWNGAEFGVPNISSVQDWDNPPRRLVP